MTAKFDGKDYPATGPTLADSLTVALTRTGPRSLTMLVKLKGKPLGSRICRFGRSRSMEHPASNTYDINDESPMDYWPCPRAKGAP